MGFWSDLARGAQPRTWRHALLRVALLLVFSAVAGGLAALMTSRSWLESTLFIAGSGLVATLLVWLPGRIGLWRRRQRDR